MTTRRIEKLLSLQLYFSKYEPGNKPLVLGINSLIDVIIDDYKGRPEFLAPKRRWTEAEKRIMHKMKSKGKSAAQIGERINKSRKSVESMIVWERRRGVK